MSGERIKLIDSQTVELEYALVVPKNLSEEQQKEVSKIISNEEIFRDCISVDFFRSGGDFEFEISPDPSYEYNKDEYDETRCYLSMLVEFTYHIEFYGKLYEGRYNGPMEFCYPDEYDIDPPILEFSKSKFFNLVVDRIVKNPILEGVEVEEIWWDTDPGIVDFENAEIEY